MSDITTWYRKLKKPSWAPKESVFGKVWGVLYIIIFFVDAYILYQFIGGHISWMVALPFLLNLIFNVLFTPIQFGLRSNPLALLDILLVLFTLIWAMVVIMPLAWLVTLLFLPYLIWVGIASTLQISITYLNR